MAYWKALWWLVGQYVQMRHDGHSHYVSVRAAYRRRRIIKRFV